MIAFVVNQFPRQVDAYFLRELVGLLDEGVDFRIYSLLPAPQGWKVHEDVNVLLDRIVYPSSVPGRIGRAAASALRQPLRTTRLLGEIATGHASMPGALAKSVAITPQAIEFANRMKADGVRHVHANWATYPATADAC